MQQPEGVVGSVNPYDERWSLLDGNNQTGSDSEWQFIIPALLAPENLILMTLLGKELTAAAYKEHVEIVFQTLPTLDPEAVESLEAEAGNYVVKRSATSISGALQQILEISQRTWALQVQIQAYRRQQQLQRLFASFG